MRVFVVGTGRCGTSTFYHACRHIHNYEAYHEPNSGQVDSFETEDQVINVSSQFVVRIPELLKKYPESKWIHLIRNRDQCVESLAKCCPVEMDGYVRQWCQIFQCNLTRASQFYYDSINSMIELMLRNQSCLTMNLPIRRPAWMTFWSFVGAQGDFESSLREWESCYNSRDHRGVDNK